MQKIQTDRLTRWPTDGQNHSLVELWCLPEEVSVSRGFEWMIMGTILSALMWCRDLAHKKTDMEGKLLWVVIKARCERHVISRRHGKIGSMIRTKKKQTKQLHRILSSIRCSCLNYLRYSLGQGQRFWMMQWPLWYQLSLHNTSGTISIILS